jgi:hypothetical protein
VSAEERLSKVGFFITFSDIALIVLNGTFGSLGQVETRRHRITWNARFPSSSKMMTRWVVCRAAL